MYGANKSLCQLILELKENHNVRPIVLLRLKGSIINFLDQHEIKYVVSHYYWWVYEGNGLYVKLHSILKQLRNVYRIKNIIEKISDEKINLVYSNSITVNIGISISRKLGCEHIWHLRESMEPFKFKFSTGTFFAKQIFINGAKKYILISDFLVNSYKNLLPENKVVRIYNGIKINDNNSRVNNSTDTIKLCLIGIICEQKNQLDAVKAINILTRERGMSNIELHLVGEGKEDYLRSIHEYIETNDLSSNIIIPSHQSDINSYLKNMNLGLVCSKDEAFGRVSIEYMLHNMPVIASRSGANEELIAENINGVTYELFDENELANKIEYFIGNPGKLKTMGKAAYEYAKSNFSSQKNTEAIYKVIDEVLN